MRISGSPVCCSPPSHFQSLFTQPAGPADPSSPVCAASRRPGDRWSSEFGCGGGTAVEQHKAYDASKEDLRHRRQLLHSIVQSVSISDLHVLWPDWSEWGARFKVHAAFVSKVHAGCRKPAPVCVFGLGGFGGGNSKRRTWFT